MKILYSRGVACGVALLATALSAQTSSVAKSGNPTATTAASKPQRRSFTPADVTALPTVVPDARHDVVAQSFARAAAFASTGNIAAAEQALTAFNISSPNTPEWEIETVQKLMTIADHLAERGNTEVPALVGVCKRHLGTATTLATAAKSKEQQSRAKVVLAHLQDRFDGDTEGAILTYEAALDLNPADAATRQALVRLQASSAAAKAKAKPHKR